MNSFKIFKKFTSFILVVSISSSTCGTAFAGFFGKKNVPVVLSKSMQVRGILLKASLATGKAVLDVTKFSAKSFYGGFFKSLGGVCAYSLAAICLIGLCKGIFAAAPANAAPANGAPANGVPVDRVNGFFKATGNNFGKGAADFIMNAEKSFKDRMSEEFNKKNKEKSTDEKFQSDVKFEDVSEDDNLKEDDIPYLINKDGK